MKILIYKRTHTGDPDHRRQFGCEGCMGRVRGFPFDAVIGIGGISSWPIQEGIARKINWVGRHPKRSKNPLDPRGPLVSFLQKDFRLFEHQGPLLEDEAPRLAKKIFGSRARFFFRSLTLTEQREAQKLLRKILDCGQFDSNQLKKSSIRRFGGICSKRIRAGCGVGC